MSSWDPILSTRPTRLHEQHEDLFNKMTALLATLERGHNRDIVRDLLSFLKQYMVEHFAAEQTLSDRRGYVSSSARQEQHELLMAAFDSASEKSELNSSFILNTIVCAWLHRQIGSTDRGLVQFLMAQCGAHTRV